MQRRGGGDEKICSSHSHPSKTIFSSRLVSCLLLLTISFARSFLRLSPLIAYSRPLSPYRSGPLIVCVSNRYSSRYFSSNSMSDMDNVINGTEIAKKIREEVSTGGKRKEALYLRERTLSQGRNL